MEDGIYYTYAYLREDGTPYYIGRGKGKRLTDSTHRVKVPPMERILLLKTGMSYEEASRHEVYLIHVLGRKDTGTGILRNMTDGGEGRKGPKPQEEVEKIRRSNTGKRMDESTKKTLSEVKKGKPVHSQETKERLRQQFTERNPNRSGNSMRGKLYWNNGIENRVSKRCPRPGWVRGCLSKGFKGGKHSPETREKMCIERRKRRHWVNKHNELKFQENSPGADWQNGRKWRSENAN